MPRIPVIEITPSGEVFQPTLEDSSSGIDAVLSGKEPVLSAGQFEVLEHHSVSPHTVDGEHKVYWLNQQGGSRPSTWDNQVLSKLACDVEFLTTLERQLQQWRGARQRHAWVYSYLGFVPRTEPLVQNGVVHIGLQSQQRPHFHVTDELLPVDPDRWLEPEEEGSRRQIARFLNVGGEESIARWREALVDFGVPLQLSQSVNGIVRHRTAFGFESLAQAYPAIYVLQNKLAESWYQHAEVLAQTAPVEFAGYFFKAVQSAVPNFVIIIPGEVDRQRLGVDNPLPVWVLPFSTIGAPEILTPGGVVLDRRPRPLDSTPHHHRLDNPLDGQQISGLSVR